MSFTDREFRDALGQFATGVAVVSADVEGKLLGSTVSSFNSVSLAPPLVLFSLARSAQSFSLWLKAKHFGVTILEESQNDLSNRFARGGSEKWAASLRCAVRPVCRFCAAVSLLSNARPTRSTTAATTRLSLAASCRSPGSEARPLLFYGGRYQRLHSERPIESPPDLDVSLYGW